MPQDIGMFNQGQSGRPGAIPSPLELASAANLRAWYDVDQETGFSDGDILDPLSNQISGLTNSNFASTGFPQYETNELDGEPVVEHFADGANWYSQVVADASLFEFMHAAPSSLMIILKPENHTLDTVYQIIDNNDSSATNRGFHLTGLDSNGNLIFAIGNGGISLVGASVLTFGIWIIVFIRQSGNGGDATMYVDNVSVATDASIAGLGAGNSTHFCRFAIRAGSLSDEFAGQISNILLWDADVESDRQALHDYFADRFPTLNL